MTVRRPRGATRRHRPRRVGARARSRRTGPLVTELFAKRAAGAGPTELADWLTKLGARTQGGRDRWSHRAIKDILRNRVYLGEAFSGDVRRESAHEPLVDPATFEAIQWRGVQFRPRSDTPSPIRPLLRCAGCRYAMRAERHVLRGGEAWMFSCRTRRQRSAWQCDEPAAVKDDGQLEQWIVDHWLDALPDFVARAREASPRLDELQADVARAQFAFEQWRDDIRVQERLGMDAYLEGIATRQDALNTSLAVLTRERARIGTTSIRLDIADVRARWTELTSVEQRDLLQSTIRCVFVRGSRSVAPLDGRLHIVWQGESIELPSRGSRSWSPRPFRFEE